MSLSQTLKQTLGKSGAALVGFAKYGSPKFKGFAKTYPGAVSVAVAYTPKVMQSIADKGKPSKLYQEAHTAAQKKLQELSEETVKILKAKGHKAEVVTGASYDLNKVTPAAQTPRNIYHELTGVLAGLGWMGKCANVITSDYGAALKFTTILTDAPLEYGKPIDKPECPDGCTMCEEACPSKAIQGEEYELMRSLQTIIDCKKCSANMDKNKKTLGLKDSLCFACAAGCRKTAKYMESGKGGDGLLYKP